MSDEAHFHLNGMVNQQDCCYWAFENLRELFAKPLHNPKVMVWCVVGKVAVIGSYFLKTIMEMLWLNSKRYTETINNFFVLELQWKCVPIWYVWFQQDGAMSHTTRASIGVLCLFFGDYLNSRFADTPWPPWSSNLSTWDYLLWGYLKASVYEHKPRTLEDLKEAIHVEVAQLDRAMLEKVKADFQICQMLIQWEHSDVNRICLKPKLMILWNFQNCLSSLPHHISWSVSALSLMTGYFSLFFILFLSFPWLQIRCSSK